MRGEKSIDLSMLFDYKYRILRTKMIENVYKNMWNNNIAITMQSGTKSQTSVLYLTQEEKEAEVMGSVTSEFQPYV